MIPKSMVQTSLKLKTELDNWRDCEGWFLHNENGRFFFPITLETINLKYKIDFLKLKKLVVQNKGKINYSRDIREKTCTYPYFENKDNAESFIVLLNMLKKSG